MSSKTREKRELKRFLNQGVDPGIWPDSVRSTQREQQVRNEIKGMNPWQDRYISALRSDEHVVGFGPAGSGKTFLAAAVAADLLLANEVQEIIMTRPPLECGEKLGFLPGDIDEKYAPYLEPFKDGLIRQLGYAAVKRGYVGRDQKLIPQPPGYIRGRTFNNCVILVDEAQNFTVGMMKAIITRVGHNCRLFITGDPDQCDLILKPGEIDGLTWWIQKLQKHCPHIECVDFNKAPCVRSSHCAWILDTIKKPS